MQPIERQRLDDLEVRLRLQRAAVDAEVESEVEDRLRLRQRPIERMHDAAEDAVLAQDPDEVGVCVGRAGMKEQRQVEALGQLELRWEVPAPSAR